jgi:endonuclease/exonuclease/phosphatase family metal-dependent hydrolase
MKKFAYIAALVISTGAAQAQTFLQTNPIFWPDGRSQYPFHVLASGLWATPAGGTMTLGGGTYHEARTINQRVTLNSRNGAATIGTPVARRTSLKVACYNTHLFGQNVIPGLPRWEDPERAAYMDDIARTERADVFCFQEVWDPNLYSLIAVSSVVDYPSGFYGGDRDAANPLNSGLFTMSRHPLTNNQQVFYTEENGVFEALASKGYIRSTFVKDGFTITVFNTHTQSGDSESDQATRETQLNELAAGIVIERAFHPDRAIIVCGDFNVIGLSNEYIGSLQALLGTFGGMAEGAKNMPIAGNSDSCTSCANNDLNVHFNPDTSNTRLDYIMYQGSGDGTVKIRPVDYAVRRYQVPDGQATICGGGFCSRNLSDHYGIVMNFELYRP